MSLSKIRDAEKSLTKKEDANEELVMMLAPRLNWVEQVSEEDVKVFLSDQPIITDLSCTNGCQCDGSVSLAFLQGH